MADECVVPGTEFGADFASRRPCLSKTGQDALRNRKRPEPMTKDLDALAAVLEAQHGLHAAEIADFFAALNKDQGDLGRAWAWIAVAETVRLRQKTRISGPSA